MLVCAMRTTRALCTQCRCGVSHGQCIGDSDTLWRMNGSGIGLAPYKFAGDHRPVGGKESWQ